MWWPLKYIKEQAPEYTAIAMEYVEEARVTFNKLCEGLEPWQLVLYTLGATFLYFWLRRLFHSETEKRKY